MNQRRVTKRATTTNSPKIRAQVASRLAAIPKAKTEADLLDAMFNTLLLSRTPEVRDAIIAAAQEWHDARHAVMTPGPWRAHPGTKGAILIVAAGEKTVGKHAVKHVAVVNGSPNRNFHYHPAVAAANAKAIALLPSAIQTLRTIRNGITGEPGKRWNHDGIRQLIENELAALGVTP